jgi:hypothetical protein
MCCVDLLPGRFVARTDSSRKLNTTKGWESVSTDITMVECCFKATDNFLIANLWSVAEKNDRRVFGGCRQRLMKRENFSRWNCEMRTAGESSFQYVCVLNSSESKHLCREGQYWLTLGQNPNGALSR